MHHTLHPSYHLVFVWFRFVLVLRRTPVRVVAIQQLLQIKLVVIALTELAARWREQFLLPCGLLLPL